jgi:hypothetical protein
MGGTVTAGAVTAGAVGAGTVTAGEGGEGAVAGADVCNGGTDADAEDPAPATAPIATTVTMSAADRSPPLPRRLAPTVLPVAERRP